MSSVENYDGLCGIIPTFSHSGLQIRCTHELGHGGPCTFEKYRRYFYSTAGSFAAPPLPEEGFLNSVMGSLSYDHHSIMIESDNKFKIRK